MGFWEVLTTRAFHLPDERGRIEAKSGDPQVRKKPHLGGHGGQHTRVAIVQIPLIVMERGPHPGSGVRVPSKGVARTVGEDHAQVGCDAVRDGSIRENVIEGAVAGVACDSGKRPAVVCCGVIQHDVENHADTCLCEGVDCFLEVDDRSESWICPPIIGYGVAPVVHSRAQIGRHQMEMGDPESAEVWNGLGQAGEGSRESINIGLGPGGDWVVQPRIRRRVDPAPMALSPRGGGLCHGLDKPLKLKSEVPTPSV